MVYPIRRVLLAPALVLSFAACDQRSVLSPREVEAQERSYAMDEHALLLRIMAKLDSFEVRAEREKSLIHARLDSLRTTALLMLAAAPPGTGNGPPDSTGNASLAAQLALVLARTDAIYSKSDSIMALTDFVAKDVAEPWQGFEVCGGLTIAGQADLKSKTEAKGEGEGGLGVKPWDTGAAGKVALGQSFALELGAGAELEFGVEGCVDLSDVGTVIPARPDATGAFMKVATMEVPGAAQLEATLLQLTSQLSLTTSSVDRAVRIGTSAVSSGDFSQLANLSGALPVANVFANPVATARGRLGSIDAVSLLCSGGFSGRIGTAVADGCGYIQANNLPDLGTFLDLGSNFNKLKSSYGALCGRFNNVVDTSITIDLPANLGTINQPLFPSNWNVSCL